MSPKWFLLLTDLLRAFIAYSNLTSGCGIHYGPSSIVGAQSSAAFGLVVGKRILPQTLMQSADHDPIEIQDLCPSDGRFKLFAFVGDLVTSEDKSRLGILASDLESALAPFLVGIVSVFTVVKTMGDEYTYLDVPMYMRPRRTR